MPKKSGPGRAPSCSLGDVEPQVTSSVSRAGTRKTTSKPKKKRADKRGAPKGKFKNPPFVPTDEQRIRVEAMVTAGATQAFIAEDLQISLDTLQRHFSTELAQGKERAIAKIGASMVKKALDGDHDAQKYTLARIGGWKSGTEISGPNGGPIEYRNLSDEELDARIDALMGGNVTPRLPRK